MNPGGLEYPCTGSHHFILLYPPPPGRRYLLLHGKIWRARATKQHQVDQGPEVCSKQEVLHLQRRWWCSVCFGHWLCKVLGRFFYFFASSGRIHGGDLGQQFPDLPWRSKLCMWHEDHHTTSSPIHMERGSTLGHKANWLKTIFGRLFHPALRWSMTVHACMCWSWDLTPWLLSFYSREIASRV